MQNSSFFLLFMLFLELHPVVSVIYFSLNKECSKLSIILTGWSRITLSLESQNER